MPLPSRQRLEAQLYRARLSSDDFTEASEYLSKFSATGDDVVKRGLLTAAIVSYCRPFTKNDGGAGGAATSQLSVNPAKLFTPGEQELHKTLLSLRREVVAHTGYDRKPVKRLKGSESGFTMSGKLFDLLSETIDLSLFATMCGALKSHCFDTMMDLNRKIVEADNAP
jgi:hypothetical protein